MDNNNIPLVKPRLRLTGQDGNAFMILGLARRAAKKAGWTRAQLDTFMAEATAGNYDHLLMVVHANFDVR